MSGAVVPLSRALLAQVLDQAPDLTFARAGQVLDICMAGPNEWTGVLIDDGRPLIAAGLWPVWHGRAQAWMVVSSICTHRQIVHATRFARQWLDTVQPTDPRLYRIEMWVAADAPWRRGFARALGMCSEGLARGWGPAGDDHVLYSRIAGDTP